MKRYAPSLLLLCVWLLAATVGLAKPPPAEPRPFVLYAQFTQNTEVTLDDGSTWQMDKGDCFPIDMFKEHQTKIVLKLGGSTFIAEASRMRVMKDSEEETALKSYRLTLENYVKAKGEKWKKEAEAKTPSKTPGAPSFKP